jgi:hypothetical protein
MLPLIGSSFLPIIAFFLNSGGSSGCLARQSAMAIWN